MELEKQILGRAREIKTDGYPMSIGEVLSLYRDGDIDIHPEFQRIFRWDEDQKSRLIESILLGIPIPPIFVSQRDDGVWDVIDGVQRLSTVLEFVGEYKNEAGLRTPSSTLRKTEYLPALDGCTWESGTDEEKVFSEPLRRDFKRAKLEFRIIRKESDANAKYDLFQRLNSGAQLSPQEARNCLLVMMNVELFNRVASLSQQDEFVSCTPLSDRQEDQAYRQELVLRFFSQADFDRGEGQLDVEYGEYLTNWMRRKAEGPSAELNDVDSGLFESCFRLLGGALGEDSFRRWDPERGAHLGPFSISSYEFVTTGLASNFSRWVSRPDELTTRIRGTWSEPTFRDNSGSGISPRRRVPKLVHAARRYFAEG
ncbi:MAG: DUF262 domain-containing protein [Actinomycetota bacterium]|nr:MAG: DUF262 domain-containing protein [Actinomycetota bacterium]